MREASYRDGHTLVAVLLLHLIHLLFQQIRLISHQNANDVLAGHLLQLRQNKQNGLRARGTR